MTVGITLRSSASVVCGRSSGLLAPCVFVLLVASIAQAQIPAHKVVLIINEVGLAHPASALVTEQVMSRLAADPRYQTEFYVESLDSPLFSQETSQEDIETGLLRDYGNRRIDVIVAMGPAPIRLLSQVAGTFLPDVPIVFCGSTPVEGGYLILAPRFKGTWMNFEVANTLEVARRLSPEI